MEEKFMLAAIRQAKISARLDEIPVGCVIVNNNKIIARAHNTKEHKKSAVYHAEINALMKAAKKIGDWRLNECDLYVTLEPCLMCVGAILNYRIKHVYFGAFDASGGAVSSCIDITKVKGINWKAKFEGGIKEEECSQILKDYFKKKRQKNKKK